MQLPTKVAEILRVQQVCAQLAIGMPVLVESAETGVQVVVDPSEYAPWDPSTTQRLCSRGAGVAYTCEDTAHACMEWLTDSRVSAQLDAAGYGSTSEGAVAVAVQQLQQLTAAHKAAWEIGSADPGPFEALAWQLQQTGKALCGLAVPGFCNNPACVNISRNMEASLVCGHTTKYSSCRTARYCSRACQVSHWKQHRPMCKGLAGVHAAKGAGSS
jgi:hypothetical protein